jgi:aspartate aminotransferase
MTSRPPINPVALGMPRSEIREVMDLAWSLGEDVVHLEVGEPDFATPAHIVEAAGRAALAGHTHYLPNPGLGDLRDEIAVKLRTRNGIAADGAEVLVSAGAVQALHLTIGALVRPGGGILLPDPAWPNFAMQAHLHGLEIQPYRLTAAGGYLPDVDELERQVTSSTQAILLNTPSNPLGTVIPAGLARELVAFAERRGLWIICDEVYDELVFDQDGERGALQGHPLVASLAAVAPSWRIVSIYSFSKVYAMTGWRVGYLHADRAVVEQLSALQEGVVSCVNAPAQHGALAALTGPQDCVVRMRESYRRRRDLALSLLGEAGIEAVPPGGTFYVWLRLPEGAHDTRALLREHRVAVAPGTAFGPAGGGCARISVASSEEDLRTGLGRLRDFVEATADRRRPYVRSAGRTVSAQGQSELKTAPRCASATWVSLPSARRQARNEGTSGSTTQ